MSLDDLVRRADPIRDEALDLDDACEALRDEIVARPVVARTRPPRRRRWLVPPAVAAVASAVALVVFFAPGDGGTERAWAAPLVKVAESVPRLLVGDWQVTRADEFAVGQGEMDFADGARTVQLSWRKGGDPIQKDGIIGWEQQGYALELRGEAAAEARAELRAVSIDEWLGAMPPSVVRPAESGKAVDQMLRDLPLPPGFDRSELDTGGLPRDRYQLGARVVGAVACGWIETWIEGEAKPRAEAVAALKTAQNWAVLKEMQAEGDFDMVVFQYADAIAAGGTLRAGKIVSVAESYEDALGC
ncbi:hypothetical protein OJ998_07390 [Solirubrobacter taibaiensis]|nr:hypothetical protein [Solirubrobacter taibaiensis]